jgi:hypothetical protein
LKGDIKILEMIYYDKKDERAGLFGIFSLCFVLAGYCCYIIEWLGSLKMIRHDAMIYALVFRFFIKGGSFLVRKSSKEQSVRLIRVGTNKFLKSSMYHDIL